MQLKLTEVVSSRTHFEVLGLGLEAYKSSKMPCPRSRTALFFDLLKTGQGHDLFFFFVLVNARDLAVNLWKPFFFWKTIEISWKICDLFERRPFFFFFFFFFFLQNTCALCPWSLALASNIPILGLKRACPREVGPWPRILLYSWPWFRTSCSRLHLWKLIC